MLFRSIPTIYIASKQEGSWVYITGYESKSPVNFQETLIHIPEELTAAAQANELTYSEHNMKVTKLESTLNVYIPLENNSSQTVVLVIGLKTAIFSQIILGIILSILIILALIIFVIRIAVMGAVKFSTKDIESLVQKMNELSEFKGDLTKRLESSSNNEVGLLAQDTNKMLDAIGGFLKKVSSVTHVLSSSGTEYAAAMSDITDSTQDIEDKLRRTVLRIEEDRKSVV